MPKFDIDQFTSVAELETRNDEIKDDLVALDLEFQGRGMDDEAKARFDTLFAEREAIEARVQELEERKSRISTLAKNADSTEDGDGAKPSRFEPKKSVNVHVVPENIHDLFSYRQRSKSEPDERALLRDGAMRAVEKFDDTDGTQKGHVERLLKTAQGEGQTAYLARRILATSAPAYKRAFWKTASGVPIDGAEQKAVSQVLEVERAFTLASTGMPVIAQLDPTIVPTSNYSVNPYRAISRVETITGTNEFKFATSGAITAAYSAEATQASDNTPTLAQPDIIVEKAQAFVQFSIEVSQDWEAVDTEMRGLVADAKDDLEATKFTTGAGHGSQEPKGIITAATTTVAPAGGVGTFAIADLYKMLEALPPRFRPRAVWLANLFAYDKVRQFDTSGGSGVWIAPQGLQPPVGGNVAGAAQVDVGARLLGKPAYEASAMDAALTTGLKPLVIGDFRYFVIVDRAGMNAEMVPLIVGTNHRPTGERGLYFWWRNSSDVLSAAAFRVLAEP